MLKRAVDKRPASKTWCMKKQNWNLTKDREIRGDINVLSTSQR